MCGFIRSKYELICGENEVRFEVSCPKQAGEGRIDSRSGAPVCGLRQSGLLGVALRSPDGSSSPDGFFCVLTLGTERIGDVPLTRFDLEPYFDPNPQHAEGMSYVRHGAFIDGIEFFDNGIFFITPVEAEVMAPE